MNTEQGRKRIEKALEELGHMVFHCHEVNNYKQSVAERMKENGTSDEVIKRYITRKIPSYPAGN